MKRRHATILLSSLWASACYEPAKAALGGTETGTATETPGGHTDSMGGDDTDGLSTTDSASASASASASDSASASGSASASASDSDTATAGTTGTTELGPRIVRSIPVDGDTQAALSPAFMLYFDRVIGLSDATGHILVSQNGSEPQPITPMACPPDADPTCMLGLFPASFYQGDTNRLRPGTEHTIIVEAEFPDPRGMTNTVDQVVTFTTFDYEPNFYDDSDTITDEFGGIAYDPASQSLFIVGNFNMPLVRRIPLPDGVPGIAATVAIPTQGYLCYGLDVIGDALYVSGTYSNNVFRYTDLAADDLQPSESIIANPTLPAPLNDLDEVWSVAAGAGSLFFAHGQFTGGIDDSSILRLIEPSTWSEFESGVNLWNEADGGVTIAGARIGSTDVLFVVASGVLYKFRAADSMLMSQVALESSSYAADLQVDSHNRVWIGTGGGLTVVDGVSDNYEVLASRAGLDMSRIALREAGDTVHVYYAGFRRDGLIGHMEIGF